MGRRLERAVIGLLFTGALAGLVALAWPLYLHWKYRQRQVILEVPSLLLFLDEERPKRRPRLEQWLLLAARLAMLLALCLLLAQPWLAHRGWLPLPPAPGESAAPPVLGVLLDDSLLAAHEQDGQQRFELARAFLRRQLETLPPSTRIRLAPASAPWPGGEMPLAEARELLERLTVTPFAGDLTGARQRLAATLAGRQAAMLVLAGREPSLWDTASAAQEPEAAGEAAPGILFFDTSGIRTATWIADLGAPPGGAGLEATLVGPLPAWTNTRVRLSGPAGWQHESAVPAHELLRLRWRLPPLGELPAGAPLTLRAPPTSQHPWQIWHFLPAQLGRPSSQLLILSRPSPAGRLADRLLSAALEAALPELHLLHQDPDQAASQTLSNVLSVVIVGEAPRLAYWRGWLTEYLRGNGRLLQVPEPGRAEVAAPPLAPLLTWGEAKAQAADATPPTLAEAAWDNALPHLRERLRAALPEFKAASLYLPAADEAWHSALQASDGTPMLLRWAGPGSQAQLWAFTWPLQVREAGPTEHPLFPLLLAGVLRPPPGTDDGLGGQAAKVGEAIGLAQWFGLPQAEGLLHPPVGDPLPLRWTLGQASQWTPDQAGVWRLVTATSEHLAVANDPRPTFEETPLPAADWAATHGPVARWLTAADTLGPADFQRWPGADGLAPPTRYDLAPLLLALLGLALALEGLALWRLHRPRPAIG